MQSGVAPATSILDDWHDRLESDLVDMESKTNSRQYSDEQFKDSAMKLFNNIFSHAFSANGDHTFTEFWKVCYPFFAIATERKVTAEYQSALLRLRNLAKAKQELGAGQWEPLSLLHAALLDPGTACKEISLTVCLGLGMKRQGQDYLHNFYKIKSHHKRTNRTFSLDMAETFGFLAEGGMLFKVVSPNAIRRELWEQAWRHAVIRGYDEGEKLTKDQRSEVETYLGNGMVNMVVIFLHNVVRPNPKDIASTLQKLGKSWAKPRAGVEFYMLCFLYQIIKPQIFVDVKLDFQPNKKWISKGIEQVILDLSSLQARAANDGKDVSSSDVFGLIGQQALARHITLTKLLNASQQATKFVNDELDVSKFAENETRFANLKNIINLLDVANKFRGLLQRIAEERNKAGIKYEIQDMAAAKSFSSKADQIILEYLGQKVSSAPVTETQKRKTVSVAECLSKAHGMLSTKNFDLDHVSAYINVLSYLWTKSQGSRLGEKEDNVLIQAIRDPTQNLELVLKGLVGQKLDVPNIVDLLRPKFVDYRNTLKDLLETLHKTVSTSAALVTKTTKVRRLLLAVASGIDIATKKATKVKQNLLVQLEKITANRPYMVLALVSFLETYRKRDVFYESLIDHCGKSGSSVQNMEMAMQWFSEAHLSICDTSSWKTAEINDNTKPQIQEELDKLHRFLVGGQKKTMFIQNISRQLPSDFSPVIVHILQILRDNILAKTLKRHANDGTLVLMMDKINNLFITNELKMELSDIAKDSSEKLGKVLPSKAHKVATRGKPTKTTSLVTDQLQDAVYRAYAVGTVGWFWWDDKQAGDFETGEARAMQAIYGDGVAKFCALGEDDKTSNFAPTKETDLDYDTLFDLSLPDLCALRCLVPTLTIGAKKAFLDSLAQSKHLDLADDLARIKAHFQSTDERTGASRPDKKRAWLSAVQKHCIEADSDKKANAVALFQILFQILAQEDAVEPHHTLNVKENKPEKALIIAKADTTPFQVYVQPGGSTMPFHGQTELLCLEHTITTPTRCLQRVMGCLRLQFRESVFLVASMANLIQDFPSMATLTVHQLMLLPVEQLRHIVNAIAPSLRGEENTNSILKLWESVDLVGSSSGVGDQQTRTQRAAWWDPLVRYEAALGNAKAIWRYMAVMLSQSCSLEDSHDMASSIQRQFRIAIGNYVRWEINEAKPDGMYPLGKKFPFVALPDVLMFAIAVTSVDKAGEFSPYIVSEEPSNEDGEDLDAEAGETKQAEAEEEEEILMAAAFDDDLDHNNEQDEDEDVKQDDGYSLDMTACYRHSYHRLYGNSHGKTATLGSNQPIYHFRDIARTHAEMRKYLPLNPNDKNTIQAVSELPAATGKEDVMQRIINVAREDRPLAVVGQKRQLDDASLPAAKRARGDTKQEAEDEEEEEDSEDDGRDSPEYVKQMDESSEDSFSSEESTDDEENDGIETEHTGTLGGKIFDFTFPLVHLFPLYRQTTDFRKTTDAWQETLKKLLQHMLAPPNDGDDDEGDAKLRPTIEPTVENLRRALLMQHIHDYYDKVVELYTSLIEAGYEKIPIKLQRLLVPGPFFYLDVDTHARPVNNEQVDLSRRVQTSIAVLENVTNCIDRNQDDYTKAYNDLGEENSDVMVSWEEIQQFKNVAMKAIERIRDKFDDDVKKTDAELAFQGDKFKHIYSVGGKQDYVNMARDAMPAAKACLAVARLMPFAKPTMDPGYQTNGNVVIESSFPSDYTPHKGMLTTLAQCHQTFVFVPGQDKPVTLWDSIEMATPGEDPVTRLYVATLHLLAVPIQMWTVTHGIRFARLQFYWDLILKRSGQAVANPWMDRHNIQDGSDEIAIEALVKASAEVRDGGHLLTPSAVVQELMRPIMGKIVAGKDPVEVKDILEGGLTRILLADGNVAPRADAQSVLQSPAQANPDTPAAGANSDTGADEANGDQPMPEVEPADPKEVALPTDFVQLLLPPWKVPNPMSICNSALGMLTPKWRSIASSVRLDVDGNDVFSDPESIILYKLAKTRLIQGTLGGEVPKKVEARTAK